MSEFEIKSITKSLRLEDTEIQLIKDLDFCGSNTFTQQVKCMTRLWDFAINYGLEKVAYKFTREESALLCQAFNGMLFNENISKMDTKSFLIWHIEESIKYESLDKFYNIDAEKFLSKLLKLDYMECVAIVKLIYDFWNKEGIKDLTILPFCKID